ncbi:MAG: glucose-1-phosphate adenylyltransferase [Methylacidiphilales bacterium]|nr:glucose-1-phosphate adenylyltransferase [Candidatus Methylacidiphilales bacterium]
MPKNYPDLGRVIGVILGGGAGTRLFPLTKERAKPAVPLAGKYRLVDIPISLCINSGIKRIFLLTQYLSSSLHRHVYQSYRFDDYHPRGFIEIMAATQKVDSSGWYQGTADAVRQNLTHFNNHDHEWVLILSGDQLYRMDFRKIIAQHVSTGADVTVATIPVAREPARSFGIMQINEHHEIVRFVEKPKQDELLDTLRIGREALSQIGKPEDHDLFLASMGIYVFNRRVLQEALDDPAGQDFGKDIIPGLIGKKKIYSYVYQGYWEDIGTIRAFYDANLDLVEPLPKFDFFDSNSPIYTRGRFLPSSKVNESRIERSIIADGCVLSKAEITHSIIGIRSRIESGVQIRDSIVMGSDYYETDASLEKNARTKRPAIGIGANSRIQGAIIDKNARIGCNVVIRAEGKVENIDSELYHVRDGIVIIPKNTVVPDGTVI